MREEGEEEEEEEGHLVWCVHKRLAVLSHKICWKGCVSPSPWLELVSCIACGKCGEGALAFKKDLSSSKQTNGQNQETGFWKHDGTLMTNSLDSLLFLAKVSSPIMKWWNVHHLCSSDKAIYNFSSCSCAPVWHNRGLAPMTNHTATTQQLLVGLARCQTHTAPTAHYVTGNPERRPSGSKGPKQIRQLSKRVRGGSFVGTLYKYVSAHTHTHTFHLMWHPCAWGQWRLKQSDNLAVKCRMTTQPANWEGPLGLWLVRSLWLFCVLAPLSAWGKYVCRSVAIF